jgi:hypothetical protein
MALLRSVPRRADGTQAPYSNVRVQITSCAFVPSTSTQRILSCGLNCKHQQDDNDQCDRESESPGLGLVSWRV